MKQITRVQELENLKGEAIARIRAVLDLRSDGHYYLYKLKDENLEEIAKNAPIYTDRIRRLVFAVYGLYMTGQKDAIALEMYSFNNDERSIVTLGNLDPHYDALMILAIADRIDELERTGIHLPQNGSAMNVMGGPPRIIRERDTYNPDGL